MLTMVLVDHENLHRLMNYQDPCAALIKLSDRLHNMRTIGSMPAAKQECIAKETLTFFVPLARHLGLVSMGAELEQLSLAVLGQ
jgi:(p)ppGpp synthase/HD superfamily hydrolase